MKRLIPTLIVLACAATAHAVFVISVPTTELEVGQTLSISIISDTDEAYTGILALRNTSLGRLLGSSLPCIQPDVGCPVVDGADPYMERRVRFYVNPSSPGQPITPGTHLIVEYEALAVGDSRITLITEFLVPLQDITIHQTPEPATIAMLALGIPALLRRRRK